MLVSGRLKSKMSALEQAASVEGAVRLPNWLKQDEGVGRNGLLARLAASPHFALGGRSGVLSRFHRRSGRDFRFDARQRVVVKALVARHHGRGSSRGAALAKHVAYLGREGAGEDGRRAAFFDLRDDGVDVADMAAAWRADRHHFRLIISPEHGERLEDFPDYVRTVMSRVESDLGRGHLQWVAVIHRDTDQPHAHVLLRGRQADGRDLVIPRDYIAYGIRARAQEAAQERLGDLSRADAEKRIWRETRADHFTRFDRRLLAQADADNCVPDGVGSADVWSALMRARLQHLLKLGLARQAGRRVQLDRDLERRLRGLQASRDVIRTLNARAFETGAQVRLAGRDPVRGRVVMAGHHDELGAQPFVVVRAPDGQEHYARLTSGRALPALGQALVLEARTPVQQQGLDLSGEGLGR